MTHPARGAVFDALRVNAPGLAPLLDRANHSFHNLSGLQVALFRGRHLNSGRRYAHLINHLTDELRKPVDGQARAACLLAIEPHLLRPLLARQEFQIVDS